MSDTPQNDAEWVSPIGQSVRDHIQEMLRDDPAFRAEYERTAPFAAIARAVLFRRGDLGLTQQEVASRAGTSHSAISRIESGQYATKPQTLSRVAAALEMRFVMGFEVGPEDNPKRTLVRV